MFNDLIRLGNDLLAQREITVSDHKTIELILARFDAESAGTLVKEDCEPLKFLHKCLLTESTQNLAAMQV